MRVKVHLTRLKGIVGVRLNQEIEKFGLEEVIGAVISDEDLLTVDHNSFTSYGDATKVAKATFTPPAFAIFEDDTVTSCTPLTRPTNLPSTQFGKILPKLPGTENNDTEPEVDSWTATSARRSHSTIFMTSLTSCTDYNNNFLTNITRNFYSRPATLNHGPFSAPTMCEIVEELEKGPGDEDKENIFGHQSIRTGFVEQGKRKRLVLGELYLPYNEDKENFYCGVTLAGIAGAQRVVPGTDRKRKSLRSITVETNMNTEVDCFWVG